MDLRRRPFSGGTGDLTINWSSGEMGPEASLLSGGYNYVTITDANGCELIDSVFIEEPNPFNVTGDIINASTNSSNDGSINITDVVGGTPPYQMLWSNGASSLFLENLLPGDYTLTVTDANGCIYSIGFLVSFFRCFHNY